MGAEQAAREQMQAEGEEETEGAGGEDFLFTQLYGNLPSWSQEEGEDGQEVAEEGRGEEEGGHGSESVREAEAFRAEEEVMEPRPQIVAVVPGGQNLPVDEEVAQKSLEVESMEVLLSQEEVVPGLFPGPGQGPATSLKILDELWFEISRHTGRIHLHAEPDGKAPLGLSVCGPDLWELAAEVGVGVQTTVSFGVQVIGKEHRSRFTRRIVHRLL